MSIWTLWQLVALAAIQTSPATKPISRGETLIARLDAPDFQARQDATSELVHLGMRVMPDLRRTLAGNPPLEVRKRVNDIVAAIEQKDPDLWALCGLAERLSSINVGTAVKVLYVVILERSCTTEEYNRALCQLANQRPESMIDLIEELRGVARENRGIGKLWFDGRSVCLEGYLEMIRIKKQFQEARMAGEALGSSERRENLARYLTPRLALITKDLTTEEQVRLTCLIACRREPTTKEMVNYQYLLQYGIDRQARFQQMLEMVMSNRDFLYDTVK